MRSKQKIIYHYTTQQGLLGIIRDSALWATHIFYLNDTSELIEPLRIAEDAIKEYEKQLPESEFQEKKERIEKIYAYVSYSSCLFFKMFVASFSENEDSLSQWRGYGTYGSAYAIGFDIDKLRETIPSEFQLYACDYPCGAGEYEDKIKKAILETLEASEEQSKYYNFLKTAATTKLNCFREEKEWRIISSGRIPDDDENICFRPGKSMIIPYYTVQLGDLSSIAEIRIGPCQNKELAKDAVYRLKEKFDLKNLRKQDIRTSSIPYRVL